VAQLSYTYDAMGRRTSKAVQGGTPTQFLYDGANAVQETVGSTINPILVGLGIDERFARNDTTGRTYFLSDAINSTIALTNSSGAIQNTYSYDPYGNTSQSGTGFTNPYQYTGREADTSGLYYYRARYYSPMMAGFISEDPVGFSGGQLSFYAYAGGDPLIYRDPRGHELMLAGIGALVGAGWGVMNGYLSGDRGWASLTMDGLAGAGTGALAGLSNGATLWEAAAMAGRRSILSAGIEATREMGKWMLPCHEIESSGTDIFMAGLASIVGDASGFGGEPVMGRAWATAFGETMGGATVTPAAIPEGVQATDSESTGDN
jgi:RHS repeat-associated protein